ncbi:hypothetical protein CBW46_009560 [Paenibacillus xerothermodurans]|uniref:Uncharacterized protein n=2 Tax=Paenibacillus xerothermodurans TaxID=1977292 RepID=A0A2W1P1F5_PAEXE|nr:hypothetical protein CBW46_009560 [Paenibacillus xerothermodurans]
MKPEPQPQRELTYRVGWKRGKIIQHTDRSPHDENAQSNGQPEPDDERAHAADRLSRIWLPAPMLPESYLRKAVWALPLLTFAISLWLVYALMMQPLP